MVNYQLGKIYKIVGDGNVYVGSTCKKLLSQRLSGHVSNYKGFLNGKSQIFTTSYECLKNNDYYIELLETCPCNSKDELHVRERFWIEQLDCINKRVPIRTDEEHIEYQKLYNITYRKLYNEKNKDKRSELSKLYYEKNKDKLSEYREKNKDKRSEYREKNKDKISEYRKLYYQCKKQ
jgi:hypothetical protein